MTTEEQRQDAQLDAIGNKTTALGYRVMSVQPEVALRRLLTHFDSTDPPLADYIRKGPESDYVLVKRNERIEDDPPPIGVSPHFECCASGRCEVCSPGYRWNA